MIHFVGNQFKDTESGLRSRAFYVTSEESGEISHVGTATAHLGNLSISCSFPPGFSYQEPNRLASHTVNQTRRLAPKLGRVLGIGKHPVRTAG